MTSSLNNWKNYNKIDKVVNFIQKPYSMQGLLSKVREVITDK